LKTYKAFLINKKYFQKKFICQKHKKVYKSELITSVIKMGLFNKKSVPEELPDLAVNDIPISPTPKESHQEIKSEPIVEPRVLQTLDPQPTPAQPPITQAVNTPSQPTPTPPVENTNSITSPEDDQGYFKDLIKSVTEETENLDKIDSWYKDKFLPGDMVFQMREYWEKQQPEILLKNISGELKNKLVGKTNKLHELEKEWQEVYFQLLAKEEAIRKEEKELKESLSEFLGLFKRKAKEREGQ